MEATAHHHEMPTSGRELNSVALSATLHCLTGCAIGEVAGVAIGTAAGFSDLATIALAISLAFMFGYALTSLPLLRAGLALSVVIPIALASDTLSIATMEIVDNGILLVIPGAMDAGLGSLLFWGSLSFALVIAGAVAVPVNRWLIARGKGHAAVHETGVHGGPPVRIVAYVTAAAFVFGSSVLIAEAINGSEDHMGSQEMAAGTHEEREPTGSHAGTEGTSHDGQANAAPEPVRGLAVSDDGLSLKLFETEIQRGERTDLQFSIVGSNGAAVRDFEIEHEKQMHFILVRRDMDGFQHLHPQLRSNGVWNVPVTVPEAGSYRVFADFKRNGVNETLAGDLAVDGEVDWHSLPAPSSTAQTTDGYLVETDNRSSSAGQESELRFMVTRGGQPVSVQPYLGAEGHLVALREGDLAYLHVHPTGSGHATGDGGRGEAISFATEFPSQGRYRLFLQFKHDGKVHTAAFTREVTR